MNIAKVLQEKGIINSEKFIESCKTYKLPIILMKMKTENLI